MCSCRSGCIRYRIDIITDADFILSIMKITEVPIAQLKPYEKNAKKHPASQVKAIARSIEAFGFNVPLVIDAKHRIWSGHGRLEAAKLLNLETLPCVEREDLTDEQLKAYSLADNKLNESDWDMETVMEELKQMSLELIDLTGFDSDLVLETKEDDFDLANIGEPTAKLGDVYQLGDHRVICGDSEDPATYEKLLKGEKPRLIYTDAPYSINYESGLGFSYQSEKFGGTGGRIFNDDKSPEEALAFYEKVLKQLHAFSSDDATIYWWFASRLLEINYQALRETDWHISQTIFWLKNSLIFSPGQLYHRIYEPCIVGWKEGETHYQNMTFSNYTELWALDKKSFADYLDVWYQKRDNTAKYIHPTQKPIQLAERALKRSSAKGDAVLDAFGGSGSTLIACEQLKRKARLIELDPKYVDAIVKRWEAYTNEKAKKL